MKSGKVEENGYGKLSPHQKSSGSRDQSTTLSEQQEIKAEAKYPLYNF